jgi:DNA ligase-1
MFKPLLSPANDPMKDPNFFQGLRFPLLCSFKLDGIRCITKDDVCKSRSFINLPNLEVQTYFSKYQELDGELIDGCYHDPGVYNRTQSTVMSVHKSASQVCLYVFDYAMEALADEHYYERMKMVEEYVKAIGDPRVIFLEHTLCNTLEELLAFEEKALEMGFEGIMARDPRGRYKHGRGTWKEGIIYKVKRFADEEAVIVGFEERMTNNNVASVDAFGRSKRSHNAENKEGAGTVGRILVDWMGQELSIAPGSFTHKQLQDMWNNPEKYLGKMLKWRHFPHGQKDKPRMPRAVGIRDLMDM